MHSEITFFTILHTSALFFDLACCSSMVMLGISRLCASVLLGCLICASQLDLSSADCWETGCQLNSWAVTGCQQYGRREASRRPCNGGNQFTCCTDDGGNDVGDLNNYGDLTYYELGLTACGQWFSDNDLVAALAFGHFTTPNPNLDPICGRQIKIVDPSSGQEVVVRVEDKCAGCQMNDVDVSPAAFQKLRPLSVGRFKVKWDFI